jgi:hypothetical protein
MTIVNVSGVIDLVGQQQDVKIVGEKHQQGHLLNNI